MWIDRGPGMGRTLITRLVVVALALVLTAGWGCRSAFAGFGDCGQPTTTTVAPSASDASYVLRAAVGLEACPVCICDVIGRDGVTAGDALHVLRKAVFIPGVVFDCNTDCQPTGQVALVRFANVVANPRNVLSLTVLFRTDTPARPQVRVVGAGEDWLVPASGLSSSKNGVAHRAMILGLQPATSYELILSAIGGDQDLSGPTSTISFHTESLPFELPVQLLLSLPERMEPGVTLFNISGAPWGPALYAVDEAGRVVWYHLGASGNVQRTRSGNLLYCGDTGDGIGFIEIDMMGEVIRTLPLRLLGATNRHHECYETENGRLLTLGYELREVSGYPDGTTHRLVGDVIYEGTWAGELTNQISLHDVLDPYRLLVPGGGQAGLDALFGAPTTAWTQTNSVVVDPRDGAYVLSLRNQDLVVKLSRAGELIWVLGGDYPGSAGDDGWPFLEVVGSGSFPNRQHAAEVTKFGRLLIYDNNNLGRSSRAVEFDVDEMSLQVRQTFEWRDPQISPPLYAPFVGDVDSQPGGTILIANAGRSFDPTQSQAGSGYLHLVEVDPVEDEKVWELSVLEPGDSPRSSYGYRAERLASLYPPGPKTKRVLVIGIDGLRPDALRSGASPQMDLLAENGTATYDAFSGGVAGTPSEQRTLTGPGWASNMTGVWADKHGVFGNPDIPSIRVGEYPHFFRRIRELMPSASLASFAMGMINVSMLQPGDADEVLTIFSGTSLEQDETRVRAAVEFLTTQQPDVTFVYLGNTDPAGHSFGFGPRIPKYMEALTVVDDQIGRLLDAVRARPSIADEDWLVVVTADHAGTGNHHGNQTLEERLIPLIVSGGAVRTGELVSPGPGQTAVPPTVLRHLGLNVDPAWGWESDAFGF